MNRYAGYVTSTLEKMKKNLWERYIFSGRKPEDYEWYCEICQELEKRKGSVERCLTLTEKIQKKL